MDAVIFYDDLSEAFINKYQNDRIEFIKIQPKNWGVTSMNDIRFIIFLEYLKNNHFDKVIISDAADVIFYKNIFDDINTNYFYACYDRNRTYNNYYIKDRIFKTYGSYELFNNLMNNKIVQAGLFAGGYNHIIKCLEYMNNEFQTLVDKNYNCNYIVYNHVLYAHLLKDTIFSRDGDAIRTKCGNEIKLLTWKK